MDIGNMLHWAVIFLIIALFSAFFGFSGVAGTAMAGAKVLFWIAIVLAVLAFLINLIRPRS